MDRVDARQRALENIQENISCYGYHLYVVSGDQQPRYAYTIGLSLKLGYEFVFAGGIYFMSEEVGKIVGGLVGRLTANSLSAGDYYGVEPFGRFSFRRCDPSWTTQLMHGAIDFYQRPDVPALQIVPDDDHATLDVPDMAVQWSPQSAPLWRYLTEPWSLPVPPTSHACTNLDALRGLPVTEACRWEEDYWELFAGAGPDVPDEEKRVVGIGLLLAADPSLAPVLDLKLGDGVWRDGRSQWHTWQKAAEADTPPA